MRKDACNLIRENLRRARFENQGTVVQSDYLNYLSITKEKFNIIILDPPYAEEFLENALKRITEIDILQSGGIIITERPSDKAFSLDLPGFERSRDYKYGKTVLTVFRKD